ncbi:MAG: hypothetical protein KGJ79_16070 [Alphaproteobacteria bacterium]|nr:hypothetical protein [Alphaproteobacteria bacterium]
MTPGDHTQSAAAQLLGRAIAELISTCWNTANWDGLLADEIVLSIKLGTAGLRYLDDPGTFTSNVLVTGRANALHILERVCNVLRARLSINTKLVTGREIVMLRHLKADTQSADTTRTQRRLTNRSDFTLYSTSLERSNQ